MAVLSGYAVMAAQVGVQIFLVPLYIHALGSYGFGVLMILLAQVGFAYLFIGLFFSNLLRLLHEALQSGDKAEFSRIYVAGKLSFLGIGLLFALVLLGFENRLPIFFEDASPAARKEIWWASCAMAVHFMLLCEVSVEQTVLAATRRQTSVNFITLCGLLVFAVAAVLWLLSGGGLVGVACCFVIGDVAARILAFAILRQSPIVIDLATARRGLMRTCRRLLSTRSQHYYVYALLAMVLQSDILILGWLGGAELTAQFALIWKIAETMILLVARFGSHLQPEFVAMDVDGDQDRLIRVYTHAYWGGLTFSFVAAAGYALFGQWVTQLWVGVARTPPDPWLYWLAGLAIFWMAIARLPAILAQALSRLHALIAIAAAEMIGKFVLIVTLLPSNGLRAPLIAISIVHVLGIAVAYAWLGRRLAITGIEAPRAR